MTTLYTIYDTATGEILRANATSKNGDAADPIIALNTEADETAFKGEALDGNEWWFDAGVKTARPAADFTPLSAAITAGDVRTLTGLPEGAAVTVTRPESDDVSATVDASGEMAITFADVGAYQLAVTAAFPFAKSEIEVNVDAAS